MTAIEFTCAAACVVLVVATSVVLLRKSVGTDAGADRVVARRATAVMLPLVQLVVAAAVLWLVRDSGMVAVSGLAVVIALAFCCAGDVALQKSLQKTQGKKLNDEQVRMAEQKARAAEEHHALVEANAAKTKRLCENLAQELGELKASFGQGGDGAVESGCECALVSGGDGVAAVAVPGCDGATAAADGDGATATAADGESHMFDGVEAALGELESETRSRYCEHKTANAIIALKAATCQREGVDFEFTGSVPQNIELEDLEMCSVLSNLLDNALNAAREGAARGADESTDADSDGAADASASSNETAASADVAARDAAQSGAFVYLSCQTKGAYLVIRVLNSCSLEAANSKNGTKPRRTSSDSMRKHGWGMQIVEQIAQRHDGRFTLDRGTPGEAVATVVLKIHHV